MTVVIVILVATAVLSAQLSVYLGSRRRDSRDALLMAATMATTAWWSAGNALEDLARSLGAKLVFANLEYIAIAAVPVFWFATGWSMDRAERGRPPQRAPVYLWIIPTATALLVWLDPVLGLVRHDFQLQVVNGFASVAKEFGPWFWVHSAYSYLLLVAGTLLMLRAVYARKGTHRAQRFTLVVGMLLPVAANLLYLAKIPFLGPVDPTPLAFSLTGLVLIVNLARFRFLALVTAAQATAIEQLRDSVFILDRDGRLAYANAAARASFADGASEMGARLSELGPPYSTLPAACREPGTPAPEESILFHRGRQYEMRTSDILRRGRCVGAVVTFFDVTRRAEAEEAQREANLQLEERIAERTRAIEESNAKLTEELAHRRRAEKQLTHDILHDPLTGLATRSLALARIEQLILRTRRDPALWCVVLLLDFDGFKTINNLGHGAGDSFLSQMAARLAANVRDVDLVARAGADEFVVLLDDVAKDALEEVMERISDALSVPVTYGATTVMPSASMGIVAGLAGYTDPESALHDADIAMHRAKASGRGMRVTFTEDLRQRADEHSLLATSLRTAIATGGITLAYQPITRLDGAPVGWEVLARWRHEQLGPVGPDRFIPIAEESGLIVPLGAWILIETLKTAAALRAEGLLGTGTTGTLFFAVNVSAIQLGQKDFAELVLSSLDRVGLPRSMLHLELTESTIMENRETATKVIERLTREGISFKLDDFGTGYSSLGYLHRIPIDCVKIDRSFITRLVPDDAQDPSTGVVRGMISLSHELHKTVVAEGIETEEQVRILRACGCDYAQGWYFGKPMDTAALTTSLRGQRAGAPTA